MTKRTYTTKGTYITKEGHIRQREWNEMKWNLPPVLNPKSYDGARALEAWGRPMPVIGRSLVGRRGRNKGFPLGRSAGWRSSSHGLNQLQNLRHSDLYNIVILNWNRIDIFVENHRVEMRRKLGVLRRLLAQSYFRGGQDPDVSAWRDYSTKETSSLYYSYWDTRHLPGQPFLLWQLLRVGGETIVLYIKGTTFGSKFEYPYFSTVPLRLRKLHLCPQSLRSYFTIDRAAIITRRVQCSTGSKFNSIQFNSLP